MYGYYKKDKLVGFLSLSFVEDIMKINDLAILPEHQSCGFGSELMLHAKEEAERQKYKKISLGMIDDNLQLKKWYEKHGFKTKKLVKYDTVTYFVGEMECEV